MVACGTPQAFICQHVVNPQTARPIDLKTLRLVFRAELDDGGLVANSLVAQTLFKKATGNGHQSVTAAIFWLKTRAGWKEMPDPVDSEAGAKMRAAAAEMQKVTGVTPARAVD